MRKTLLLLLCVFASIGAWAQTGTYGSGDNTATISNSGSTLTVTGKGDITNISGIIDVYTKYFTDAAVGNVFTNNTGTSVTNSTVYNQGNSYYTANRTWNQLFEGGVPTTTDSYMSSVTVDGKFWDASKLSADNAYMYSVWKNGESTKWNSNGKKIYGISGAPKTVWIAGLLNDHYVYRVYVDFQGKLDTYGRVTSGDPESGTILKDDVTYTQYVISDTEISFPCEISDLSEGAWIKQSEKDNYTITSVSITSLIADGSDYTLNESDCFSYNGSDWIYVKCVVSDNEFSVGDIADVANVTLLTKTTVTGYKNVTPNVYLGNDGRYINQSYTAKDNVFTYQGITYSGYILSSVELAGGSLVDLNSVTLFTKDELETNYVVTETRYTVNQYASNDVYRSTDEGVTKSMLTKGQTYTYNSGDLFYVPNTTTYELITSNNDYFTEHDSYIRTDHTQDVVSFVDGLKNVINSGAYTMVTFEQEDNMNIIIDKDIIKAVTLKNGNNKDLATLDLSQTTVPQLTSDTFDGAGNYNGNLKTLYLPKTDDGILVKDVIKSSIFSGICDLIIPEGYIQIADDGFINLSFATGKGSISFPASMQRIGAGAFGSSQNVCNITFSSVANPVETPLTIGDNAFNGSQIVTLEFPSNLRDTDDYIAIGASAFAASGTIESIIFNDSQFMDGTNRYPVTIGKNSFRNNASKYSVLNLPEGLVKVDDGAFFQTAGSLMSFTLPNTLEYIGKGSFSGTINESVTAITFPASIQHIGGAAFHRGTGYRDVYFLGADAPELPYEDCSDVDSGFGYATAFNSKTTYGNNGYTGDGYNDAGQEVGTPNPNIRSRENYHNSAGYMGMLHLRADLTEEQRAKFTDVTRGYRNLAEKPSLETAQLPKPPAPYSDTGVPFDQVVGGGYLDNLVGDQYIWPTQVMWNRAHGTAWNGVLWDGVTTYDSRYQGLHEFVLVSYDVNPGNKTDEWEFNFGDANWWTICVPVNMTVSEVRSTFGDDTQVCKFSNVIRDQKAKVKFYFCDEKCLGKADLNAIAIEANVAYMIRPSSYPDAGTKFVLPNYTIARDVTPIPTPITINDVTTTKEYTYTFVGNYQQAVTDDVNEGRAISTAYMPQYSYYLGATTKDGVEYHKLFFQLGTTGKWKPYTAVVLTSDGKDDYDDFFDPNRSNKNTQQEAKGVNCSIGIDDFAGNTNSGATGIEYEVICGAENAPSAIYNLNGQFVGNASVNLPKGVYVKNGKKFIVK